MTITLLQDVKDGSVTIPKGTKGTVRAFQWGESGEKYIVDFIDHNYIRVDKEDALLYSMSS